MENGLEIGSKKFHNMDKIYSLEFKNRTIIDNIFDKLHQKEKMFWSNNHISSEYSVFVVWRNQFINEKIIKKSRIIVDFQKLNKIIESDIYSISLQINMINAVTECLYIFIINVVFFFINNMFFLTDKNFQ